MGGIALVWGFYFFLLKGCRGVVIVFKEVDHPLQEIYPGKDDNPDKDPVKH